MKKSKGNDENYILLQISKKLRHLRKEKGYTSYETFSYDYNLDRKQYWRIENGANFTLKTLIKILKIHQISLQKFFEGIE